MNLNNAGVQGQRPLYRGDIVLVMFPFSDLTSSKRRPAVVLWASLDQEDYTLAFISSQNVSAPGPGELPLLNSHAEFGLLGLSVSSKVRASKIVSLHRSLITRYLGRLGPILSQDLDDALITALGINTERLIRMGRTDERNRLQSLYQSSGADALLMDLENL